MRIPEGATIGSASHILAQAGAIRSATWFRGLAGRLGSHDPIRAGEFAIQPHASAAAILDTLQHGKPALKLLTIPEGTPSVIVHDKLMATTALTGAVPIPARGIGAARQLCLSARPVTARARPAHAEGDGQGARRRMGGGAAPVSRSRRRSRR